MSADSYSPKSVQEAWDNHLSAFGCQDVPKTLLDYDENSTITVHNFTTGEKATHKGIEGAREMFTGIYELLSDTSDLGCPLIEVSEGVGGAGKMVFVVWQCLASGVPEAADTFIFGDTFKVVHQNVVIKTV